MKLAITSDLHLGNLLCSLVEWNGNEFKEGPKYRDFCEAAGTGNDYLVLLGDILDFSVAGYDNAYAAAKVFFTLLQKDNIADQYIYIPGNHDYDIWNIVENEVNIILQMREEKIPRKFRTAIPGILDDRTNTSTPGFTLPGVGKRNDGPYTYGGLFLDHITDDPSHFIFAYPNLYLASNEGTTLITHGQYLDNYWSLLSKWAPIILEPDLKLDIPMDIKEMVGMNFPFNQLSCSGVGQAGILTESLSRVQHEIKDGNVRNVRHYLNNLFSYLDDNVFINRKGYQYLPGTATGFAFRKATKRILAMLTPETKARYSKEYFQLPIVQERFFTYFNACLAEVDQLKKLHNIQIEKPGTMIFGHTHLPITMDNPIIMTSPAGTAVNLCNTGGWLWKRTRDKKVFRGAVVFRYESGKGIYAQ